MAYFPDSDWRGVWLNPDGTWTYSAFKAHFECSWWWEFADGSRVPAAFYGWT